MLLPAKKKKESAVQTRGKTRDFHTQVAKCTAVYGGIFRKFIVNGKIFFLPKKEIKIKTQLTLICFLIAIHNDFVLGDSNRYISVIIQN